jgi:hypothetical protein
VGIFRREPAWTQCPTAARSPGGQGLVRRQHRLRVGPGDNWMAVQVIGREIKMNSRSGGIGIVGVIVIVLVILWLVGVIKLWGNASALLLAVGLIGSGVLAVLVLTGEAGPPAEMTGRHDTVVSWLHTGERTARRPSLDRSHYPGQVIARLVAEPASGEIRRRRDPRCGNLIWWEWNKEDLVIDQTPPRPGLPADFAAGESTEPLTPEESSEADLQGDFAAGERTEPLTLEESSEAGLHGDFSAGERTEPLTPEEETPGTFADTRD